METPDISVRIKPRFMARGVSDLCIGLFFVFPLQVIALCILPGAVAFLFSHSWVATVAAPLIVYLIFIGFTVWHITLTSDGIRFHRLLGTPKFLPWSSILSVEIAPQRELIVKGWLWPLLPAREMTTSLTSLGHYRISWTGGFCYYPPADAEVFYQYVTRHLQKPVV